MNEDMLNLLRRIHSTFGYDHGDDIKEWIKDKNDLLNEIGIILDEADHGDYCDCVGFSHNPECRYWVLPL